MASNDTGECVILDHVIVTVADGYTVDQAAAELNSLAGWSTRKKWYGIEMLWGEYSPDNLTLDQLLAEIDGISNRPWASHASYDSFAGIAGTPNAAPAFTSGTTHTVGENQWGGGTVNATDEDEQDSVSYSIVGGADAARFRIYSEGVAWDGLLEFLSTAAPDYEAPHDADGDNEYQVRVMATSGANDRVRSAEQDITVIVTNANDAPTGAATISGTEKVGETLTAATSGIADQDGLTGVTFGYQWVRVDGANDTDISDATSASYTLVSADQGKKVKVRVGYTDQGNFTNSVTSADSGVIAAAETQAPDPVASVSVVHNGASLTVTWDAPTGATRYDVTYYNSTDDVNARAAWNRAGAGITISNDVDGNNAIDGGDTYTVGVRARNAAGESAWTNSAPASLPVPAAVTNIQVTHNGTSLTVSWDAPAGATHYDVTYYNNTDDVNARAAWNHADNGQSPTLTITCDSRPDHQNQNCVESGDTYTVGIRARNAAGESSWVNSAAASYTGGG